MSHVTLTRSNLRWKRRRLRKRKVKQDQNNVGTSEKTYKRCRNYEDEHKQRFVRNNTLTRRWNLTINSNNYFVIK